MFNSEHESLESNKRKIRFILYDELLLFGSTSESELSRCFKRISTFADSKAIIAMIVI